MRTFAIAALVAAASAQLSAVDVSATNTTTVATAADMGSSNINTAMTNELPSEIDITVDAQENIEYIPGVVEPIEAGSWESLSDEGKKMYVKDMLMSTPAY